MYKPTSWMLFLCITLCLTGCSAVRAANEREFEIIEPSSGEERLVPPITMDHSVKAEPESEPAVSDYEIFLSDDGQYPLTIESYLQQKCAWNDGFTSLYLEDESGAYYVYRLKCSPEEFESMRLGQKIRITGYKTVFSGEPEITDAAFTMLQGEYYAEPVDISEVPEEQLYRFVNRSVKLRGVQIEPMFDGRSPFFYEWDNSGSAEEGSDLYFTVSGSLFSCSSVVKTQLRPRDSDTYLAVQSLTVGDSVDLTGILTWYNGPQLLITDLEHLP